MTHGMNESSTWDHPVYYPVSLTLYMWETGVLICVRWGPRSGRTVSSLYPAVNHRAGTEDVTPHHSNYMTIATDTYVSMKRCGFINISVHHGQKSKQLHLNYMLQNGKSRITHFKMIIAKQHKRAESVHIINKLYKVHVLLLYYSHAICMIYDHIMLHRLHKLMSLAQLFTMIIILLFIKQTYMQHEI